MPSSGLASGTLLQLGGVPFQCQSPSCGRTPWKKSPSHTRSFFGTAGARTSMSRLLYRSPPVGKSGSGRREGRIDETL